MTAASAELRFWIDMALECVRRDHTPSVSAGDQKGPFRTARALGMALVALNDANAIAASRPALLNITTPPGLAGSNPVSAAAAACFEVLALRYPAQRALLDAAWDHWAALFPSANVPASALIGRAFGNNVVKLCESDSAAWAVNDPLTGKPYYTPTHTPYTHDAPPNEPGQGFAGANWGAAKYLVPAAEIAGFAAPPGRTGPATVVPNNPHYRADFDAVVAVGVDRRVDGNRKAEQELIGIFWGYDGPPELGTPPRLYMQAVLAVLDDIEFKDPNALNSTEELAIVAAIGIAMSEAGINAWKYKYSPKHMMWRPAVGIPRAVEPTPAVPNPGPLPIPGWVPLGRPDTNGSLQQRTPDFPAYPSGHATFGSAAFHLLRLVLVQKGLATFDVKGKDNVRFDFVSDEYNGRNRDPRTQAPREHITRTIPSLWDAIVENSISRAYLGVHWYFDGITKKIGGVDGFGIPDNPTELGSIGGVWLGAQIAKAIAPKLGVTPATIAASKM